MDWNPLDSKQESGYFAPFLHLQSLTTTQHSTKGLAGEAPDTPPVLTQFIISNPSIATGMGTPLPSSCRSLHYLAFPPKSRVCPSDLATDHLSCPLTCPRNKH